jgi:peptide deformylase
MALLKIARMGHPVLLGRAAPVPDPTAPDIRRLVADMIETMLDARGVGLAAPQVHVPLRLFVMQLPAGRRDHADEPAPSGDPAPLVVINPSLEPLGDERVLRLEGCLSIPGLRALVPRWLRIRYAGVDTDNAPVGGDVGGFHANVVQHEYDHLDGILYPMRVTDFGSFGFEEELARFPRPLDTLESAA